MYKDFEEIATRQGWSDHTVVMLMWTFLTSQKLSTKFIEYAKKVADVENTLWSDQ